MMKLQMSPATITAPSLSLLLFLGVWSCRRRWARVGWAPFVAVSTIALGVPAANAESARQSVEKLVAQIKRADYEGDRAALKQLFGDMGAYTTERDIADKVRYWRGFALWRRAINGVNDNVPVDEQEKDLRQCSTEFHAALAESAAFADAKIGAVACYGLNLFLHPNDPAYAKEFTEKAVPLVRELRVAAPNNPRYIWITGPGIWTAPAERGGGQEKAIEWYEKGLETIRKQGTKPVDPLEPAWGEPELLMNLAWSNLNRKVPDLDAAERFAGAALAIVPNWHYVKDILLPQIKVARKK